MLNMNHITATVYVRIIFGYAPTPDNFWTDVCLTSQTSDGIRQIFV